MKTDRLFGQLAAINNAVHNLTYAIQKAATSYPAFTAMLDTLAKRHTAFPNFAALVQAEQGYFPSLPSAPDTYNTTELVDYGDGVFQTVETKFAELDLLALAYDITQEERLDPRRALRVKAEDSQPGAPRNEMLAAEVNQFSTGLKYLGKHAKIAALFMVSGFILIYVASVVLS